MRKLVCLGALIGLLGGCADVQMLGAVAIEKRRTMNDMQARVTMAAACDIAIGAYYRELNEVERRYVALVCGGTSPSEPSLQANITTMRAMEQLVLPARPRALVPGDQG